MSVKNKDPEITNARINNLVPPFGGSRRLPLLLSGQTVGFFFLTTGRWTMWKTGFCRCVNQGLNSRAGVPKAYPTRRRCKCGSVLSIYNGGHTCHACFKKENFPHEENELSFQLECALMYGMDGAK